MTFSRRQFVLASLLSPIILPATIANSVETNEDGLHVQPWFLDSFMDMQDDHGDALSSGKHLAVIFEQRGCPYCREMHTVNFAKPEIADFIKQHFSVVQINLWGARETTDFDGETMEERALARKWGVNFTPTIVFFPNSKLESLPGRKLEIARMPGYMRPFHFISMFEFVQSESYRKIQFQRFLQHKFEEMEKKGIKPEVW